MDIFELLKIVDRPLLFFDTETTGPNPNTDFIVEIGCIQFRPDGTTKEWQTYINPGVPIPAEATFGNGDQYPGHGITDAMVQGCRTCCMERENPQHLIGCPDDAGYHDFAPWPSFKDLAPNLTIGFSNTDFGGYNIKGFDLPLMVTEFGRAGITWSYANARLLDGYRLWQLIAKRSLSDASQEFLGRKHEGAHRALDDIRTSVDVVCAQLKRLSTSQHSVATLHDLQWPVNPNSIDPEGKLAWRDGQAEFTFGKWRGVALERVDRGYFHWVVNKSDMSEAVKTICALCAKGQFPVPPAPTTENQ